MLSFKSSLLCLVRLSYTELAKKPVPQNIPINITTENVWTILHSVESDYEKELVDVMEDSNTEFIVEDKENEGEQFLYSTNTQPHVIIHDKTESVKDVDNRNECPSEEKKIIEKKYIIDTIYKTCKGSKQIQI